MNVALAVLLGLSVLVDLALGAWAGVAWGSFTSRWLPPLIGLNGPRADEVRLLLLVLGLCLFAFAALQGLALRWVLTENEAGHRVAIVFGSWLVLSSIVVFAIFRRPEFLLIDGLRGAALALVGVLALNAPATVRELRLPDRPRERRPVDRPRRDERELRRRGGSDRRDRRDASRDRGRRRERPASARRELRSERGEAGRARPDRSAEAEAPERPLTVVIRGASDRVRPSPPAAAAGSDDEIDRAATVRRESAPARGHRRRRRRRRSEGEEGPAAGLETAGRGRSMPPPFDPAVEESELEEPSFDEAGERSRGEREGRRRRRRRRSPGGSSGDRALERPREEGPAEAAPSPSPVEALDMLSLLEPIRRVPADDPYGRGRRSGDPRFAAAPSGVSPTPGPGPGPRETREPVTPPPSVRPDYGREEESDSDREPD